MITSFPGPTWEYPWDSHCSFMQSLCWHTPAQLLSPFSPLSKATSSQSSTKVMWACGCGEPAQGKPIQVIWLTLFWLSVCLHLNSFQWQFLYRLKTLHKIMASNAFDISVIVRTLAGSGRFLSDLPHLRHYVYYMHYLLCLLTLQAPFEDRSLKTCFAPWVL